MAQIYVVSNAKGGILKSTLVSNLAAASVMTKAERDVTLFGTMKKRTTKDVRKEITGKTLVIDLDAQSNQRITWGLEEPLVSVYNVMMEEMSVADCIIQVDEYIDLLPSNYMMNFLNFDVLTNLDKKYGRNGEHLTLLRDAIDDILDRYRYIFIDCPPAFDVATLNAFMLRDAKLIVPVQPEGFSVNGLDFLFNSAVPDAKKQNPSLDIAGLVVTLYDDRTSLHSEVYGMIYDFAATNSINLYGTKITKSIGAADAVMRYAKPLVQVDKKHKTSRQILELFEEMISNEQE